MKSTCLPIGLKLVVAPMESTWSQCDYGSLKEADTDLPSRPLSKLLGLAECTGQVCLKSWESGVPFNKPWKKRLAKIRMKDWWLGMNALVDAG